jgi:SAM-dependent methyltransferase
MELERLQEHWNALGEQDPLWAALVDPDKRGGGWDLEEFFATGRRTVDQVLTMLDDRGIAVEKGRALDFGCGVGRLTLALAEHFESTDGVDVAASMIERAREFNTKRDHKGGERTRFHHSAAADLRLFDDGSFDFVLSLIVLRHVEPALMRGYMREFLRVLRPGGVAFFDVPERLVLRNVLPPEGWSASLSLNGTIPPLIAGRVASLKIKIRNNSSVPWPTSTQLEVGNHWRSPDATLAVFDDARAVIASPVDPGGECEVQLNVRAPAQSGSYELELDVLQELVGWFADRGSSALRLPVSVLAAHDQPVVEGAEAGEPQTIPTRPTVLERRLETHVMGREAVVDVLEDAGGVVLDIVAANRCGPSMPTVDYVVARALAQAPPRVRVGDNPQATIEARIRGALQESCHDSRDYSKQLSAAELQPSEKREYALRLMEERADLVGFGLSSRLKGVGRASTALRTTLRRAMLEVLYRQTEHNRAINNLMRMHEAQLEALAATVRAQIDIQADASERVCALERRLAPIEVNSVGLARRSPRGPSRARPSDFDYLGFTERYRGTSEDLKDRQRRYVARFEGLSRVVDLGCGRGEFLELLREAGISAVGVDIDQAAVGRCRQLGLDVVHRDALRFLQEHPEDSHGGIFAAQLVEHLEREDIVKLMRLAVSRLRPGGVLLIEATNPMCLLTYTTFYDDFTRIGPVPPLALKWLAESCGLSSVEIEYNSPVPAEHKLKPLPMSTGNRAEVEAFNRGLSGTNDLLFGFQQYALVARKPT